MGLGHLGQIHVAALKELPVAKLRREGAKNRPPEIPGTLTYYDQAATPAMVRVAHRDRRQRILRAVKVWGTCWGFAAVSVFVPIAHFVLVPGFLIAGPVLALRWLREEVTVIWARGACPACAHEQEFSVNERWRQDIPLSCDGCRRGIHLITDFTALVSVEQ